MSAGVCTPDLRVRFVEKSLSEVGDGTAFPMLATLDQIAEVFYRVKDAQFVSGFVRWEDNSPPYYSSWGINAPSTLPSNRSYAASYYTKSHRGYTTPQTWAGFGRFGGGGISAHNLSYLGDAYDRGDGELCHDIADDERGMWLQGKYVGPDSIFPFWNITDYSDYYIQPFRTAFSFYSFDIAGGDTNCFRSIEDDAPSYFDVEGFVGFSGEIAVVKSDPDNGFFDPSNQFYIGMRFIASDYFLDYIESDTGGVASVTYPAGNYKIRLADVGGSPVYLSCPLYTYTPYTEPESYEDFAYTEPASYEDFVHEAIEWWPYAKIGGLPVWDSATGVKL